jgi:hypothetical protein
LCFNQSWMIAAAWPASVAGVARLPACKYRHVNVHGHYSFTVPGLTGGRRPLRDPDQCGHL